MFNKNTFLTRNNVCWTKLYCSPKFVVIKWILIWLVQCFQSFYWLAYTCIFQIFYFLLTKVHLFSECTHFRILLIRNNEFCIENCCYVVESGSMSPLEKIKKKYRFRLSNCVFLSWIEKKFICIMKSLVYHPLRIHHDVPFTLDNPALIKLRFFLFTSYKIVYRLPYCISFQKIKFFKCFYSFH